MDWCSICKNLLFDHRQHICPPKWRAWNKEDPANERIVYGIDAEEAAEKFHDADSNDSCEYTERMHVVVADEAGNEVEFETLCEFTPTYSAWPIRSQD